MKGGDRRIARLDSGKVVIRVILFVTILLSGLASAMAIQVTPDRITVSDVDFTREYSYVISIINDDPRPVTVRFIPGVNAQYLKDAFTVEPFSFGLLPDSQRNVQLTLKFPSNLGPETHTLDLYSSGKDPILTVEATVSGTPVKDFRIVTVEGQDTSKDENVVIDVQATNFGNIIVYARPIVVIRQGKDVIGTINYPTKLQVLPQDSINLTLLYSDFLDPGTYQAEVYFEYDDTDKTETLQDNFKVIIKESSQITSQAFKDLTISNLDYDGEINTVEWGLFQNENNLDGATINQFASPLIIPTADLEPGDYTVRVVINPENPEIREFNINLSEQGEFPIIVVVIAAIGLVILSGIWFLAQSRIGEILILKSKINHLESRCKLKEKELTVLVEEANRIHESLNRRPQQQQGGFA